MKQMYLEKYFSVSRAVTIRKKICGIKQHHGQFLYEYWEGFKRLCASCPYHQISNRLLIQYFYEGLLPIDKNIIDNTSGGALADMIPTDAMLITNMIANSQQFSTRQDVLV